MRKLFNLVIIGLCTIVAQASANPFTSSYAEDAREATDLSFKSPVSFAGSIVGNQTYASGVSQATSPAVVLLHSCSGINKKSESHLSGWTAFFIKNGFHVLVLDHLGARGKNMNCGSDRTVSNGRLAKDLLDATHFLSTLPEVDKNRIFSVGFSLGGMTGGLVASQKVYDQLGQGRQKPRAIASLYGGCYYPQVDRRYLHDDTTLPVLWLLGQDDLEAPFQDCESTFKKLTPKGSDFVGHIYPNIGHCWDCKDLDGFSKNFYGKRVTYRYNRAIHTDSEKRVLEFLNKFR